MEKISTNHSLINKKQNLKNDELAELVSLLKENNENVEDVFNYLNSLEQDVNEEKVQNIIEYAKRYRAMVHNKENAEIR